MNRGWNPTVQFPTRCQLLIAVVPRPVLPCDELALLSVEGGVVWQLLRCALARMGRETIGSVRAAAACL
jgi:hypothetical protein